MVITTEASTLDQAKQFPLDTLREDILVLFDNQIVEKDATVSDTNYDSPGADVDIYIRQLIIEQSLPLKDVRLTRIEVLGDYLFKQVCDYVKVYDVLALNTSYVYFLESKNFAITIISVDLLDGTTRVHMEPMEISEGFLTKMWKEAIDKKKKKVDIRNIPGVTRGFPKQSKTLHTGGAQIEKFPRRM